MSRRPQQRGSPIADRSITRSSRGKIGLVASVVFATLLAASLAAPLPGRHADIAVIVHETLPATDAAEALVVALGGRVTRELPLVGAFAATIPGDRLHSLTRGNGIAGVWADAHIGMASTGTNQYDTWEPNLAWRKAIRLGQVNVSGSGVTVALLDTGVANVDDLGRRVDARIDFTPNGAGDDEYGHGTHLAGVIAGNGSDSGGKWRGVATGAHLISIKVAGRDGSTDVSVVIAALQWIVTHRDLYNIRVLNLAFGTDGVQPYALDPLDAAVERAWAAGITVVVSAGNRGSSPGTINKPGDDPYVITVGAADLNDTTDRSDDQVAPFSSRGPTQDGFEKPDLVAPGITIVSTRSVGSTIDQQHQDAVVDADYFKGTGTSQAAAIVSGVAALMYDVNPSLKPNQVKGMLLDTAFKTTAYRVGGGAGLVDAEGAVLAADGAVGNPNAGLDRADGIGALELSRGTMHVTADLNGDGSSDEVVQGEIDVLGEPWDSNSWSSNSWSSDSWSSNSWSSLIAENDGWSSNSWSSNSWSGMCWSSNSWSSNSWSSIAWS
jgi:serine protease AprX